MLDGEWHLPFPFPLLAYLEQLQVVSDVNISTFPFEGAHPTGPKSFVYTTLRGLISVRE